MAEAEVGKLLLAPRALLEPRAEKKFVLSLLKMLLPEPGLESQ